MTRFSASLASFAWLASLGSPPVRRSRRCAGLSLRSTPPPWPTAPTASSFARSAWRRRGRATRRVRSCSTRSTSRPPGSPHYVDALYWRAVVAATAADAERDLRRIIIEFPLSPRNEDALLRLAQLEMTRGDNDQALAHLQRLVIDHPTSPSRARASFWMARVYFDKNQTPAACRSLADARAQHVALHRSSSATRSTSGCSGATASIRQRSRPRRTDTRRPASTASTASAASAASPSTSASTSAIGSAIAGACHLDHDRAHYDDHREVVHDHRRAPGTSSGKYTVQVGAYPTRDVGRVASQGSRRAWYRCARGRLRGAVSRARGALRYARAADAAAQRLKAKKISVYVTEAEPQ